MFTTIHDAATGREVRTVVTNVRNPFTDRLEPHVTRQARPMARSYRITDPETIGAALERRGWSYRILPRRSKWRSHLVVELGAIGAGDYFSRASILCAHDGRTSLQIRPGAVRGACENEFLGAPIRIAHTDPECDVFLGNPDEFLRTAILNADRTAARIERLRGLRAASDPCYGNPGLVVRNRLYDTGHKRLAAKYEKAQYMYAADAWGILQALSLTRSPSLILAASRAVSDEFFDLTKAEGLLGVLLETLPAPKKPRKGAPKPQHNQPHPRW